MATRTEARSGRTVIRVNFLLQEVWSPESPGPRDTAARGENALPFAPPACLAVPDGMDHIDRKCRKKLASIRAMPQI